MGIQVVRILTYEYATAEVFLRDRAKWTENLNLPQIKMVSSVLPVNFMEGE